MAFNKIPSQKEAIKAFLVCLADGTIDVEASCDKFRSVALQVMASKEGEENLISSCMSAIFDQYKGAKLNAEYITSATIVRMSAQVPSLANPSLHTMLRKRIIEVLKEQTGEGKIYGATKGPGGGHYRFSDQAK